eukprot:snap_masked-scaffold1099_size62903-processed-gene-0.0 protein:Tk01129 transcript:snap_masked-scaffold1099_size62903-processed-gene-0.0-mRNA-1 annotation:"origin recognition complex subunit 1-like"
MANKENRALTRKCLTRSAQVVLERQFGDELSSPSKRNAPSAEREAEEAEQAEGGFTLYSQLTDSPTKIHIKRRHTRKGGSRRCSMATPTLAAIPEDRTSQSVGHAPNAVRPPRRTARRIETPASPSSSEEFVASPQKRRRKSTATRTPRGTPTLTPTLTPTETPQSSPKKRGRPRGSLTKTPRSTPRKTPLSSDTPLKTPRSGATTTTPLNTPKSKRSAATPRARRGSTTPRMASLTRTPLATPTTTGRRAGRSATPQARAKKVLNYAETDSESEDVDWGDEDDDDIADRNFHPRDHRRDGVSGWSDSDEDEADQTLKARRKALVNQTPVARTPKSVQKRLRMTPKMPQRAVSLSSSLSPIQEAQVRLHVSAVPDSLPCREDEFAEIYSFTEGKIQEQTGGCMYISGWPGTGKTATVMEVIRTLQQQVQTGDLEAFQFIEINAMRLTEPSQAYVQLWSKLTTEKVTANHAMTLLDRRFARPASQTTVLLIDELDMLCNRKQSVLYNLFEWPTRANSKLVVLAIANAMDLPERVMINRVSSRLGLTRLTFSPYTFAQLQEIVSARLAGLKIFDKDALQLVSRKVASLSGDARRALDICRRATEIAQRDSEGAKSIIVNITHVLKAHEEMFCSPKIVAIRACSNYQKMFLRAIIQAFQKSGLEETSFERVFRNLKEQINYDNLPMINTSQAFALSNVLAGSKLIIAESGKYGVHFRIRLNVSQDDVLFALDSGTVGRTDIP